MFNGILAATILQKPWSTSNQTNWNQFKSGNLPPVFLGPGPKQRTPLLMFHIIVLLYENNNGCKTQCKSITFKVFGPTSLGTHVWKGKFGISTLLQSHFIEACPVADKHSQSVNHKHYNISPVLLFELKTKVHLYWKWEAFLLASALFIGPR